MEMYNEKERLSRQLIAWETIGFSWGWMRDSNFRDGNVDDYLKYSFHPINGNVLIARGPTPGSADVGMSVLEGTVGQGRVLASQLNVFMSLERDCVAAEYLHNLLEYACASQKWYEGARPLK